MGCAFLASPRTAAPAPHSGITAASPGYPMWHFQKKEKPSVFRKLPASPPAAKTVSAPKTASAAFWAWCWSGPSQRDTNLFPMIWVHHKDYFQPAKIAAQARWIPRGKVALFFCNAAASMLKNPADTCRTTSGAITRFPSPWLTVGAVQIGRRFARFFRRYKAVGGRLNYLVLDYESGLSCWQISPENAHAISVDPRFTGLKYHLGFTNIMAIFQPGTARKSWNKFVGRRIAQALNLAFFLPAATVFPSLSASNYGGMSMLGTAVAPDTNGHYQPSDQIFGNTQSPAFYGDIGQLAQQQKGGQAYGNSPFAVLRYEMLYLQAIKRTSHIPIVPWIGYPGFANYGKATGYYRELVYQLALRGVNQFLYWNPRAWLSHQAPLATAQDDALLDGCLAILNTRLGPTPGKSLDTGPVHWNSPLLVAGRTTTNGQILYRVTVPPGTPAIIAQPGNDRVNTAGKTGVWVTTSANQPLTFTPQ